MSRYSRCSCCKGPFNGGNYWRCTNVSFGDEFVCNPDSFLNNETPDFSYSPSQPQTSSSKKFHGFWCGDPLEEGVRCQQCTCKWCGNGLSKGFCFFCASRNENSSINVFNPNSFNDTPDIFTHPPQPQYETNSCELCGNDSHYGYDYPPRFSLVYEQELCYNQNFGDNYYPQNSLSFPHQYLCCDNYGGPHENFQCQPRNQNFYEPNFCDNSNYSSFDQPSQYSINHQPQIIHEDLEWISKINNEFIESIRSLFNEFHNRLQAANISTHSPEPSRRFKSFYDDDDDDDYEESTNPLPPSILITNSSPVLPIRDPEDSIIMRDEDLSTIPEKESDEVIKSSIKNFVPIPSESEDTFGNDSKCDLPSCNDFSPINALEGNCVTFSNPLFDLNDDFTSSDDESLSDEDVPEDNVKIYSNPLFEFNDEYISSDVNPLFDEVLENIENKDSYDFSSSDDESLSDEDVPEDNVKIYSNPLFEFNDEYISSDVNPLFDEVLENIENKDSYDFNLDEPDLLVTPLSNANKDECFDP
uniref:Pre-mRNA splicing Prp18-interacting factor n=1 Tax=Tanacetum cinerariifolium TaxID=118510 RepID=A0A6L2L3J9_TANCI|nr:hypothetical protein [Tanacetum cinerariifolium]